MYIIPVSMYVKEYVVGVLLGMMTGERADYGQLLAGSQSDAAISQGSHAYTVMHQFRC